MRLRPALALAAALWAAGALAASAEEADSGGQRIYRWIDENGIAHYTTDPARIPAPLRDRIGNPKALSQKPLEARAPDSWADLDVAASAADAEAGDGDGADEANGAEGGEPGLLGESGGAQGNGGAAEDGGESNAAAEDGRAEAEAPGGARGESELPSETRGSELNGGTWQSGRRGSGRGLRMRAARQRMQGGANIAPRFATGAGFPTSAAFAAGAAGTTGGIRLAGAGAESALQPKRERRAELNARIAELEARIAAEEEVIKSRISAPDTAPAADAADGGGDEALLARAARLPGWLAELRALREERAALPDGG